VIAYASIINLLTIQIHGPAEPALEALLAVERIDQVLARGEPDAPCVSFEGRHWTYRAFDVLVDVAAQALRDAGLRPGDRLALLCTPRPEYLLLLMAASRIGASTWA
jgi:acyl-CoA synthetase (AMP-forming)/AMP-acid ligase II